MRRRLPAIGSHEAAALGRVARRTQLVRIALAAAAVLLLAAAAASARRLEVRERGLLPSGTTGVIVIDLSLSIGEANYQDVRAALRRLVAADEPIGLVVFSDVPYELLPPGTPAKELSPILRLLAPRAGRLAHPWQQGFRAGTRISEGLILARALLERDGISSGSILLLSDLDTAPDDFDVLARTLNRLRNERVPVRVVPLAPSTEGRMLFEKVLGTSAFTEPSELSAAAPGAESGIQGRTPLGLLVFGGLCLTALAAHERFGARLALPGAGRARRSG